MPILPGENRDDRTQDKLEELKEKLQEVLNSYVSGNKSGIQKKLKELKKNFDNVISFVQISERSQIQEMYKNELDFLNGINKNGTLPSKFITDEWLSKLLGEKFVADKNNEVELASTDSQAKEQQRQVITKYETELDSHFNQLDELYNERMRSYK